MRGAWLLLFLSACVPESPSCGELLGERRMLGYRLDRGEQLFVESKYTGFLVSTDKPGHYSVGWADAAGGPMVFSGTVSTDGTIDPQSTFAHTRTENLVFDAANQISFHSAPGKDLHGVDLAASSDVIYLDGYINGSHLGVTVSIDNDCVGYAETIPVAFTGAR